MEKERDKEFVRSALVDYNDDDDDDILLWIFLGYNIVVSSPIIFKTSLLDTPLCFYLPLLGIILYLFSSPIFHISPNKIGYLLGSLLHV